MVTNIHGWVKSNLVGSENRLANKQNWSTYPFVSPVDGGTLCSFTDPLQDRSLSCVCSSYNKYSELDIWESTTGLLGLLGVHRSDGG